MINVLKNSRTGGTETKVISAYWLLMENNSLQRYTGYVVGMRWASFADINELTDITIFLIGETNKLKIKIIKKQSTTAVY
jgi:hypothetical protein